MPSFFKLSGAGNDFIALIGPAPVPTEEDIRRWCRRALSLGADGVLLLYRTADGGRLVHHNADGGRSDLCLNGSRCAAQLAFAQGWGRDGWLLLTTDAGILEARQLNPNTVELSLPLDLPTAPERLQLEADGALHEGWYLHVGVPHLVLDWPTTLTDAPVASLGARLRSHPRILPGGANVNFVRFISPDRFEIRTFERGVEGETLACGTGVIATVQTGIAAGRLRLPVRALTSGGFELTVSGDWKDGIWERLALAGDARLVARGELLPGASELPDAPRWT